MRGGSLPSRGSPPATWTGLPPQGAGRSSTQWPRTDPATWSQHGPGGRAGAGPGTWGEAQAQPEDKGQLCGGHAGRLVWCPSETRHGVSTEPSQRESGRHPVVTASPQGDWTPWSPEVRWPWPPVPAGRVGALAPHLAPWAEEGRVARWTGGQLIGCASGQVAQWAGGGQVLFGSPKPPGSLKPQDWPRTTFTPKLR